METVIKNIEIKAKKVMLIGQENGKPKEMALSDAIDEAQKQGLDLIMVSKGNGVPVVKIMDKNKYAYEKKKQKKKSAKPAEMKEIRFKPTIADMDFMTKVNSARKFLEKSHEVKFTLMCRGREIGRINTYTDKLERIASSLSGCSFIKSPVKVNGRLAYMILAPKKH